MYVNKKWSEFIMEIPAADKDSVLLCSTMGFNVIRVKRESDAYRAYVEKTTDHLTPTQESTLEKSEFLIDPDFDERAYCDFFNLRSMYADSRLSMTILPTDACNFRCVYCYESAENHFLSEESEHAILKFLRLNLRKYRDFHLAWFGGEPLVRKEQVLRMTKEINALCKAYGVTFSGSITTNGYELDESTFEELVRNRILSYLICIDGNQTSHNRQRPHFQNDDSYQRIMSNIKAIKNNCKSRAFLITLRSNVTAQTEQYMDAYLDDLWQIIGDDKRFKIVFQGVREWGGERIHDNRVEIVDSESRVYSEWYLKAAKRGFHSAERLHLDLTAPFCAGNFINGFIVNPDCSLHKCTLCYYNPETKSRGSIGKINSAGVMEVDDAVVMNWLSRKNNHIERCDSCKLYPTCKGGHCPFFTNIGHSNMGQSKHCDELNAMAIAKVKCMELKNLIPDLDDTGGQTHEQ